MNQLFKVSMEEPLTAVCGYPFVACVQTSPISFVARGKEIGDVCTQATRLRFDVQT